jgi:uncharacterized membrane protein YesL
VFLRGLILRNPQAPFNVIAEALTDWWDGLITLSVISVMWMLCCVTVLLGPPATFGLYYVTNRLAHGENVGFGGFFEGGRNHFRKSWLWALLNLTTAMLLGMNYLFYAQFEAVWALALQVLVLGLSLLWLCIQFYALPFLMEQEDKQLRLALRNGLLTTVVAPVYTLIVVALSASLIVLSFALILPLFFGALALVPSLGNRAMLERVETFGVHERDRS